MAIFILKFLLVLILFVYTHYQLTGELEYGARYGQLSSPCLDQSGHYLKEERLREGLVNFYSFCISEGQEETALSGRIAKTVLW